MSMVKELREFWDSLPNKALFAALAAAWVALFHFLGHSQLGWIDHPSLFAFLGRMLDHAAKIESDDAMGRWIPWVFLVLVVVQRRELTGITKAPSILGFGILCVGTVLHTLGYIVQQVPLSFLGFLTGLYGLTGVLWGRAWLARFLFPYVILLFAMPVEPYIEGVTFKLRHVAAATSTWVCVKILGLPLVRQGTMVSSVLPNGTQGFQFEVAAACSGIRSLKVILLLTTIYGFLNFGTWWRRIALLAVAPLLAVGGNVGRLVATFSVGDAFGETAAKRMETNAGYLTFLFALGGVILLGRWLREGGAGAPAEARPGEGVDPQDGEGGAQP